MACTLQVLFDTTKAFAERVHVRYRRKRTAHQKAPLRHKYIAERCTPGGSGDDET